MLVDAEQNTEKESEVFFRLTTRGSKQFNKDYKSKVNSDEVNDNRDQKITEL